MIDHPETEIQFIRRIMAMLLTLAGIAERAAGYPYPIRAFLMWVLRRAEKAAQDFVDVEDLWPEHPTEMARPMRSTWRTPCANWPRSCATI